MPLSQEQLDRKINQLTVCYRMAAIRLLDKPELNRLWIEQESKRPDMALGLKVLVRKTEQEFRNQRHRVDQDFADFIMLLEASIDESPASGTLLKVKQEIKEQYPEFRIGVTITCKARTHPIQALIALPKRASLKLNANDRRFLRSLRIATDDIDQQD